MEKLPLDHIGVAVKNLETATIRYVNLLGAEIIHEEVVESQGVKVRFLSHNNTLTELLQPLNDGSTLAKFLAKRGEGLHHVAYAVSDIYLEMERMRKAGYELLQDQPFMGAREKLVFFIHPRSMGGVLVEICQPKQ